MGGAVGFWLGPDGEGGGEGGYLAEKREGEVLCIQCSRWTQLSNESHYALT